MALNTRGKLFAVLMGLVLVSALASELYLGPAVEENLLARIRGDLEVRLALVGWAAETNVDPSPLGWGRLADDLAARASGRVTFVAGDGRVIGDSEVRLADLAAVTNHRDRPEIAAALAGAVEASTRYSATVHKRCMYAAAPVSLPGGSRGAVRLAVPLDEVSTAVQQLRRLVWSALGVTFLVAIVVASGTAHILSRELRRSTWAARKMAAGNLDVRVRPSGRDEVAELGRVLDTMAGSLATTLTSLRAERDLLGLILESMREGVLVLDRDGRVLLVNAAVRNTFRLPPAVEGRAALELIRNADLQAILERARTDDAAVTGEVELTGPKPLRLLVHATRLPALDGSPRRLLAVLVDITEIRRLEVLRRDFLTNVSHELRTPITSVRSAVDTLRLTMSGDPTSSERFVDIIERNATRLGALVEDLLDLSRIESKNYRPQEAAVSLRLVSDQTVAQLRARIDASGMTMTNEIGANLRPARADRQAVEQVFTNLLDNAVKYCGQGAIVTLRASDANETLRIEVADTGPGIEGRHLPRLFERFYRVDSGRSRDQGGTGLGLAIVKHLVEAMGGAIGVESKPGAGSTFWFTLPLATEAG